MKVFSIEWSEKRHYTGFVRAESKEEAVDKFHKSGLSALVNENYRDEFCESPRGVMAAFFEDENEGDEEEEDNA